MSVLEGRIHVADAVPLVAPGDTAGNADVARYGLAGTFRQCGFRVFFSPSRTIPIHVSVAWPYGEWGTEVAELFGRCFDGTCRLGEIRE